MGTCRTVFQSLSILRMAWLQVPATLLLSGALRVWEPRFLPDVRGLRRANHRNNCLCEPYARYPPEGWAFRKQASGRFRPSGNLYPEGPDLPETRSRKVHTFRERAPGRSALPGGALPEDPTQVRIPAAQARMPLGSRHTSPE